MADLWNQFLSSSWRIKAAAIVVALVVVIAIVGVARGL